MTVDESFLSWGDYDRDDPFPLFAQVRERGPVHRVTLVDGHEAWLIVDHDEARAALNDRRLSKDMSAALASGGDVVAEGLPGPDFAHHMLVVDPPDHTRLRRLVQAAFSVRRVEQLRPHVESIVHDLLDDVAAAGPDSEVDLVRAFAFPVPFTVICELLGIRPEERAAFGRALGVLLAPTPTPESYARAKSASDTVVEMLKALVAEKKQQPDECLVRDRKSVV
jgi:cytochrome P450